MSESDDENYAVFGSALDPLDEENLPRKKAVTLEDQYAYDEQGRRRFHGAFTGGFSAGYFNSVGTRDGWRPQQFKSSRSKKAENVTQRPQDFMDDEDTGEFGIAPTGIRATGDFTQHGKGVKRERPGKSDDGPIPGTPALKELLRPVRETVGITLLKKMGWKPGQGVGPRLTKKEKNKIKQRNEAIKVYGCSLLPREEKTVDSDSENSDEDVDTITFAPDDYEPFRCNPKDNFFGIGYSGLDRRPVLSGHVNLFDAPALCVQDKNKKLSIRGQAFGVGAFEADDEDIYERDDMSRYDFTLGPEKKSKSRWNTESSSSQGKCIEGFIPGKAQLDAKKIFRAPELPKDFKATHVVRKSRFFPPIEPMRPLENGRHRGFARHDLNADDRSKIINDASDNAAKEPQTESALESSQLSSRAESSSVASNIISRTLNLHGREAEEDRQRQESQRSIAKASWLDKLGTTSFVKGGVVGSEISSSDSLKNLEQFKSSLSTLSAKSTSSACDLIPVSSQQSASQVESAKPFLADPDKQRRFEQFLIFAKKDEKEKLASIQPLSMTEWDREHERVEFEQAARLFASTVSSVGGKLSNINIVDGGNEGTSATTIPSKKGAEEVMKEAAKMKMFGKLTRQRVDWQPSSIVCKRFNIPEPKVGCARPELEKKQKFSLFDCLDWTNSTKFETARETVKSEPMHGSGGLSKLDSAGPSSAMEVDNSGAQEDAPAESSWLSEKARNFEASYEKVFGKGVEGVKTRVPEESEVAGPPRDASLPSKATVEAVVAVEASLQVDSSQDKSEESSLTEISVPDERAKTKDKSKEKKDLFKAIFLSSSEDSDSEVEEKVDSEVVKSVLIGKTPGELNTQRNTSPPRGIFATLDLDSLTASSSVNPGQKDSITGPSTSETCEDISERIDKREDEVEASSSTSEGATAMPDGAYGPALPTRICRLEESPNCPQPADSQTQKHVFKSVVVPKFAEDPKAGVWVEKRTSKKSKKEKKKHKHKERSKHKRKSKKEKR